VVINISFVSGWTIAVKRHFFSIKRWEQVTFRWDDGDGRFVLDKHWFGLAD
jgi:hypothetical protein